MNNVLNETPMKYQVKVGSRIICEKLSRTAAEIALDGLSEDDKAKAQIVPVASNGNQVLFG